MKARESSLRGPASPAPALPLAFLLLLGCACRSAGPPEPLPAIDSGDLLRHIAVLASDDFEGRGPGTRGEELTVAYLVERFEEIGLAPGNPDGTYVQKVPLVGFRAEPAVQFRVGDARMRLAFPDDYVAVSRRIAPEVRVSDSELLFVGYGVVAPEYGWDDYKGADVRGKTILMLVNDPAVPDPQDPSKLDEAVFKGRAMTYYGRWTYKFDIASRLGAAAAVLVHETGPAGYPYDVVQGSWSRENFDLESPDKGLSRVAVEAWIRHEVAAELLAACGQDLARLEDAALSRDFRPVPLDATADFEVKNALRRIESHNVVARLEGSGPLKDEHVVYSAHWDHLGRADSGSGDRIYNGALDNASGTAGLLEIAEAFRALPRPPRRSILFLAVTAEEKGLLGSKHYAASPLHPLEKTLANINMDGLNPWGRTRDVVCIGLGNTTLEEILAEEAAGQGRSVEPDAEPEKGYFYRSDHFEFAKRGVPALDLDMGTRFRGRPDEWGRTKRDEYTERDYHKPSDEVKPDWDLSGAVEDLNLLFRIGLRVANAEVWPEWKPGSEFKAARDEMLKAAGRP